VRSGWRWADESLAEIARLHLEPIVGLVHHGSGPLSTSLLDDDFPVKVAEHARSVAERFPHIEAYTPINEPLTTARFSGLYGFWYPHATDDRSFVKALFSQLKGIVLSMRSIRYIQPAARLIQTEDIGQTWSSSPVQHVADFYNLRRWLTFDALTGRIDANHPLTAYLLSSGMPEAELYWFTDNPCPPNVLGINYYLTSDRFLDHRVQNYPKQMVGGNGHDIYADVEAVRGRPEGIGGAGTLLRQTWERYGIAVSITEVQNGSGVEQQILWFNEIWEAARLSGRNGIPVVSVTPWALVGSYDWPTLVTKQENRYESGAFCLDRNGLPVATALAAALRCAGTGNRPTNIQASPWWRDPDRLIYQPDT
jgi:dTDP-4-dehydrorhamnose reductase